MKVSIPTLDLTKIIKLMEAFYKPSKIFEYSNHITIKGGGGYIYFQLPVIESGSSNAVISYRYDCVVDEPFDVAVNFEQLAKVVQTCKSAVLTLTVQDHLLITFDSYRHVLSLTTWVIPPKIRSTLLDFRSNLTRENANFYKVKDLYEALKSVSEDLNGNMLAKAGLDGIYMGVDGIMVTDGLKLSHTEFTSTMALYFPRTIVKILKEFPQNSNIVLTKRDGIAYSICDNIEMYFEEWMYADKFPKEKLDAFLRQECIPFVKDVEDFMEKFSTMYQFSDRIILDGEKNQIISQDGTTVIGCDFLSDKVIHVHGTNIPKSVFKTQWTNVNLIGPMDALHFTNGKEQKVLLPLRKGE